MAVQRQRRLQPQHVSGPKAARSYAAVQQNVPNRFGIGRADHQFEAIFPGVSGAADEYITALQLPFSPGKRALCGYRPTAGHLAETV